MWLKSVRPACVLEVCQIVRLSRDAQSRLIQLTNGAPVALALNGSVFSMVQALGATLGGVPSPAMASPPSRPRP